MKNVKNTGTEFFSRYTSSWAVVVLTGCSGKKSRPSLSTSAAASASSSSSSTSVAEAKLQLLLKEHAEPFCRVVSAGEQVWYGSGGTACNKPTFSCITPDPGSVRSGGLQAEPRQTQFR